MIYNPNDVASWGGFRPLIIAHDVARSRDRSTAVVGGLSPYGPPLLGVCAAEELPQGQFGAARASALAVVDRRYHHNSLIVADLSNDPSYADPLIQTFGQRVIGVQIGRFGNGIDFEMRPTQHGCVPVYNVGRTNLLESLHSEFQADRVRLGTTPEIMRAYEQLANLELEYRESGAVYVCASGRHDDLGISLAMLSWAARHPHLTAWVRNLEAARRPRRPRPQSGGWAAHT
jgi:hypothetical protein